MSYMTMNDITDHCTIKYYCCQTYHDHDDLEINDHLVCTFAFWCEVNVVTTIPGLVVSMVSTGPPVSGG